MSQIVWNLFKARIWVNVKREDMKTKQTRPCVGYAKDWLGQLFLFPDLVCSGLEKEFWLWSLWRSQEAFSSFLKRPFWHGDDEQANNQVKLEKACSWPLRIYYCSSFPSLIFSFHGRWRFLDIPHLSAELGTCWMKIRHNYLEAATDLPSTAEQD